MPNYLKKYETNTLKEKILIAICLLKYGVIVNVRTGQINYNSYVPKCKCSKLRLLRHGKTIAVEQHEFMSNSSNNSILSDVGKNEIEQASVDIKNDIPDVILIAPLTRTLDTYNILKTHLSEDLPVKCCKYMVGINNGTWENKKFEMLDHQELYVFLQRECCHNIFAKSKGGDSWGDVLVRCSRLLKKINKEYSCKNVLLVSQGSIYQGLKILLHKMKNPWEDYSPHAMFSTMSSKKIIGYGKTLDIC